MVGKPAMEGWWAACPTANGSVSQRRVAPGERLSLDCHHGHRSNFKSYEVATDARYQAVLDDGTAKDAAMKRVCSGG